MTVHYSDGTTNTFTRISESCLAGMEPAGVISFHVSYYSSVFTRINNVPDCTVVCSWSYTESGATVTTTSTVTVKGQVDYIVVPDGEVRGHTAPSLFTPSMTIYHTDGYVGFLRYIPSRFLVSFAPDNLVNWWDPYGGGGYFYRRDFVPDGIVTCTWCYTEGVTVTTTSTITVKGVVELLSGSTKRVEISKIISQEFGQSVSRTQVYEIRKDANYMLHYHWATGISNWGTWTARNITYNNARC